MEENDFVFEEISCHIGRTPLPMPDNALELLLTNYSEDSLDDFEITLELNGKHHAKIRKLFRKCKTEHDKIYALNSYLNELKYVHRVPERADFWEKIEEVEIKFDDEKEE